MNNLEQERINAVKKTEQKYAAIEATKRTVRNEIISLSRSLECNDVLNEVLLFSYLVESSPISGSTIDTQCSVESCDIKISLSSSYDRNVIKAIFSDIKKDNLSFEFEDELNMVTISYKLNECEIYKIEIGNKNFLLSSYVNLREHLYSLGINETFIEELKIDKVLSTLSPMVETKYSNLSTIDMTITGIKVDELVEVILLIDDHVGYNVKIVGISFSNGIVSLTIRKLVSDTK